MLHLANIAVTDRQLELLAFVFDEKHLEHALVIVQKRMLKKLVGTRSKRTCWQVRGKSGAKEEYLVYPTHYCSCRAFQWDVLSKGEQLICKHMLAVRVAEALDDYNSVDIDDALLAQMLEAYANESAADGGGGGRGRGPPRGGGGGGGGGGACGVRRLTFTATFDDGVVTLHLVLADVLLHGGAHLDDIASQNLALRLRFFGALNPRYPPPSCSSSGYATYDTTSSRSLATVCCILLSLMSLLMAAMSCPCFSTSAPTMRLCLVVSCLGGARPVLRLCPMAPRTSSPPTTAVPATVPSFTLYGRFFFFLPSFSAPSPSAPPVSPPLPPPLGSSSFWEFRPVLPTLFGSEEMPTFS